MTTLVRAKPLTAAELVLFIAARMGYEDIDHNALVVAAWLAHPWRFGLNGFEPKYPDSKRVSCEIARLYKTGLLDRPSEGKYRVTQRGREVVNSFDLDDHDAV